MKEKIEARVKHLVVEEFKLIQEIGQLEKTLEHKRATLISTRGGILELNILLKKLDDDGTDVSEQVAKIEEARMILHRDEEE